MGRVIDTVIVHCSATSPSQDDVDVSMIRDWHVDGNGWSDIGYHFVITRQGVIQEGRSVERAGAHAKGHNETSIGICLVGGVDEDNEPQCNFSFQQYRALVSILSLYPDCKVIGHNEVSSKACPCFDVQSFVKGLS